MLSEEEQIEPFPELKPNLYSHQVRSVLVDDGTKGKSVSE